MSHQSVAVRVREHRERLRKSGMRPIQLWVPDTRKPTFSKEIKRQSLLVSKFDDVEVMDFIEAEMEFLEE